MHTTTATLSTETTYQIGEHFDAATDAIRTAIDELRKAARLWPDGRGNMEAYIISHLNAWISDREPDGIPALRRDLDGEDA